MLLAFDRGILRVVSTFYRVARLSLQAQAVEDSRRRSRMGKTKGFIEPKGSRQRDVRRDGRAVCEVWADRWAERDIKPKVL